MEDREDHSGDHGGEDSSSDEKCDNSDDDDTLITMCWSVLPLFHFISMSHALAVH
jgi:hypothetical protein